MIPLPQFLPGRVVWRCQTQILKCSHCTSGRWLTSGPWPPALSWWDAPHAGPGGSFSKEQWSWGKPGNGIWLRTTTMCTPTHWFCEYSHCYNRTEKSQKRPQEIYSCYTNRDSLGQQEISTQMNLRQSSLHMQKFGFRSPPLLSPFPLSAVLSQHHLVIISVCCSWWRRS